MAQYPTLKDVQSLTIHPIPHVALPAPHDKFCLSPMLSTDVRGAGRVLMMDSVASTSGQADTGEEVQQFVEQSMMAEEVLLELTVIRSLRTLGDAVPDFIGFFELRKMRPRAWSKARPSDPPVSRDGAHWTMSCFIDPAFGGTGLMTIAGQEYMKLCPYIHDRPGIVFAGYEQGNAPSRRLQARLGFRPIGKWYNARIGKTLVDTVWEGAGRVDTQTKLYERLQDMTEEDFGEEKREDEEHASKKR
ncbi:hypothetical protein BD324DRAFT_645256 [Kockovaella imperatae]|uniref:N-acetyltransferase domain-containing protein n=1 Tax=Kockovaella imperatae TaxID=4999 RepID=A0A1Y1UHY3_9TREE|nr:hypothetical protein BD324DRAFT_645256 [Kockovaella imperatae]ORX37632.1 hypothetical protein BD324DRAFT_645256 [Kockovaella imperatae]